MPIQRTHYILQPDEILPNLYLADLVTACASLTEFYRGPSITHILSLVETAALQPRPLPDTTWGLSRKLILIDDRLSANILTHLKDACDYIALALSQPTVSTFHSSVSPGVLVHCKLGRSRSATVVIAYVMRERKISFFEALKLVQEGRQVAQPNRGFVEQLHVWERCEYDLFYRDEAGKEKIEKAEYIDWKRSRMLEVLREMKTYGSERKQTGKGFGLLGGSTRGRGKT